MGRVISYPEKTGVEEGDFILMDSGTAGTKKIKPKNVLPVDITLSRSGQAADAAEAGRRIGAVADYNTIDILRTYGAHKDTTHNGVTFAWNGDVCTVSGTAASSGAALCNLIASTAAIPSYFQAGKSYRLDVETTDSNVKIQFVFYYSGGTTSHFELTTNNIVIIPNTAIGIIIRLYVAKSTTVSGSIKAAIRSLPDFRDTVKRIFTDAVYSKNLLHIYGTRIDERRNGVGFLWDGNVCYVCGTASSGTFTNIITSTGALPICFQAGKTYHVKCDTTDSKIKLRFQWYKNGLAGSSVDVTSDTDVTIPADVTGLIVRIFVASGDTVDGAIYACIDGEEVESIDLLRANVTSGYISITTTKIKDFNYTIGASNTYYITDYIPVKENRGICITGYELANRVACGYFDADYKPIKVDRIEESARDIDEHHGKTPYNCKYIRFHLLASQIETFNVFYTNYDDSPSENVIYPYIFNRQLFQTIADIPPMCAVIDDDTSGLGYVTKFHDKCVENGITGNYAVITKYLDQSQTLADTLLGYEDEGFGMLYHCQEQLEIYRDTSSPNRDMAAAEVNFCTGLRKMRTYGFLDYNYWIIPYGTLDDEMRALAQRHGMQCCFSAANSSYVTTTKRVDRWSIPRMGLVDTDTSVTNVKALMDECYAAHGMFYLMTHFNSGWDITGDMDRFDEVIQYAKNLGYNFVTVPEAMRYWMPVYRLNEMF